MIADVATPEVSRHKCLIYDGDPAEQLPVIVPLLQEGLSENRRCLYLGDPGIISLVKSTLQARGVDVSGEIRRGSLIFSSDRGYLNGGFDPKGLVDMLGRLVDEAVQDGYTGLCATGDMGWELGTDENFEKLLEYEALLEKVFREKPLKGVCQYNRRTVPHPAVRDALQVHRSVYIGSTLHRDNLFYTPPDILLDEEHTDTRARRGEWMYQQISRILKAEENRDRALKALEESEARQRRLAEELAEANRDLERRVRERTVELEAANAELEAFSYSVSHDLRAPLRHIESFSQLLAPSAGQLKNEAKTHLAQIVSSAQQMGKLIHDLLNLSRITRTEFRREVVSLAEIARGVADELAASDKARKVRFSVAGPMTVRGDRGLLTIALRNLLGNAWKFTSKNPEAHIEVGERSDPDRGRVFFVRDDGAGFDPAYASKLFQPFQRLHTAAEFEGTGIGLAIVRRVMARHGGQVWAESRPGKGATFFFTLRE
jgi:signal transduction histidine kinase